MVLKVYGMITAATERVLVVLEEKKVPYEIVDVALLKGEHKSAAYLEKQPFGQIPCIDDDGFILYESRAICHYIASQYPNQGIPLIPTDPKGNARFHQAVSVEVSHFEPCAVAMAVEKIYKPVYYKTLTDEVQLAKSLTALSKTLDVYDGILAKQAYMGGDELTLADFNHLPYLHLIKVAEYGDLIETRPNVKRWVDEISSRPSWKAVLALTA